MVHMLCIRVYQSVSVYCCRPVAVKSLTFLSHFQVLHILK